MLSREQPSTNASCLRRAQELASALDILRDLSRQGLSAREASLGTNPGVEAELEPAAIQIIREVDQVHLGHDPVRVEGRPGAYVGYGGQAGGGRAVLREKPSSRPRPAPSITVPQTV